MMQTNRTSKPSFMAALAALVLSCAMTAPVGARPDGDDKVAAIVQPADVTDLKGKEISYATRNDYVTTNRPQENGKMFVLYNVGAKKFLNVGSYWGTHAALSNVPRLFWLQRRNEKPVSPSWGYVRYPETPGMSEGSFKKNFFALTTMQVGSKERSKQSNGTTEKTVAPHAYYEYVRYYAPGNSTPVNIIEKYTATGETVGFMTTIPNVDLLNKGGHIEARIDMSACEGDGSSTDGKTHMETLLSFGADIAHWNYNGIAQNNLHIFGFKKDGKSYIRVCPIDASYSDATHKSGGNENPITIESDNLVTIEMGTDDDGKRYLKVNNVDCMPRVAEDKTSPIASFFNLNQLQMGSLEGNTRSHGIYDQVRLVTERKQDLADTCVVKPGAHYTAVDGVTPRFYRQYKGNLEQWEVRADLDLTTCTGTDENVLSVGTDIANWASEVGYNLHFYYTPDKKYIKVNTAKGKSGSTTNAYKDHKNDNVSIDDPRHVTLLVDQEGVHVDGTLVSGFDPTNDDVLNYLLGSAASLQVGSRQGNASHAIYRSLAVTKAKRTFPDETEKWDKRPFMQTLNGNLKQWEIVVNMDLSTCTSGSQNENVLSIGTDIASWSGGDNLHLYYTPTGNSLQVAAVNSSNPGGIKATVYPTDSTNVTVKLNATGLYVDGSLVYGPSNSIIGNLLDATSTKALQVGSKEGNGSDALYKSFSFTEQTVKPDPTFPVEGEAWIGNKFSTEQTVDFSTRQVRVNLDLSSCTGTKENVLSIGNAIDMWNNEKAYNIHLYYTKNAGTIQVNSVKGNGNSSNSSNPYLANTQDVTLDDKANVTVVLNKDGLYVGSELVFGPTDKVVEYLLSTTEEIQVGSKEGSSRSHATYNKIAVEDYAKVSDPETPTYPVYGSKWNAAVNGNLADNPIEATIDLSGCTGTTENVLSVGTDIKNWGNGSGTDVDVDAYANNIHIYYTKGANFVNLDVVSKTKGYTQYKPAVTAGGTLTVKLTNEGLWINGTQIDDSQKNGGSTGVLAHVIDYLATTATAMQVGSLQGTTRSHATYTTLTAGSTSLLGTAQASAQASALFADESGSTATSSNVEATDVPVAQEYVPYDDFAPNGGKFSSENYNISFAGGDKIEATVDLSKATEANENIFSIGSDIASWLNDDKTSTNLHIYYAGTDADGDITMSAAFVNKANNNGLKRAFSIPASSPVMKLTLSKDGLIVNGHDIFASTDTIPAINYDAALAGDIVRFECDANGQFVHNADGELIEVKPGTDGYENARGTKVSIATGYIYTDDAHNSGVLPLFMSSKFKQETTASSNEDVFFSWAPRLKNSDRKFGNVGVFADRGLPQPEISNTESLNCSQWFFEPAQPTDNTAETGHNLYRIYLKMDNVQYAERKGSAGSYTMGEWETREGQHKYYLQGAKDNVYGNALEDYYTGAANTDVTLVDALADNEGGDLGLWKVIDIAEYNELFDSPESEMTNMLDLSFLLSDPSFSRENPNLTGWNLEGRSDRVNEVRVGYDYYSKKKLDDTDYTDEHGNKDLSRGGVLVEKGSNQYDAVKGRTNNHARYMGFGVLNNANNIKLHQDVTVTNPGWYAVICSGVSNAGAKLFVQKVNADGGESAPVEMPLRQLTEPERIFFNNPNVGWPFDKVDDTHPMPMYNALVAMNDRNIVGMEFTEDGLLATDAANPNTLLADRYTSQVAFFVDEQVLKDNNNEITLRLGVSVPSAGSAATTTAYGTATQATVERADEDATVSSTDKWTVVDDFHLLFGGRSEEPNLVLNEDSTSLGYIDRSLHAFDARPMRLYRTFAPNKWNTIILPVNLSKSDFVKLFGEMAESTNADGSQLAKLDHLTKNTVEFVSVKDNDENGVMLKAFKPYIIKVKNANGSEKGQEAYEAQLAQRKNSAEFEKVGVPEKHYYLDVATLEGKRTDSNKQPYYTFEADTKDKLELTFSNSTAYTTGYLYTYRDKTLAERTDADETDGSLNISNLRAYGTLCKNYATAGTVLDGRPTLKDGYVMQNNNLYKIKNQYGTKGFRCWFASDDATGQLLSSTKVSIDGIVDGTTGIADIYGDTGAPVIARFADGVYTIDGRKVRGGTSLDGLPAGVYIVNGSKTVVSR